MKKVTMLIVSALLATNMANAKDNPNYALLVSFSMPISALQHYCEHAGKLGVPLVLRGLVDESLTKTASMLAHHKMDACTWQVDPNLFVDFNVGAVPALVALNSKEKLVSQGHAPLADLIQDIESGGL